MTKEIKSVFDWMEHIYVLKTPPSKFSNKDWSVFNAYVVHRIISMGQNHIEISNLAQRILPTDKLGIYNFYRNILPRKKVWNQYVKSKTKPKNKDLLLLISKYFECSSKEADTYIDMLGKLEIKNILSLMGNEKKEITKLLKP